MRSHKERSITYAADAAISVTRSRMDFSPFATEQAVWGDKRGSLKNRAVLSGQPSSVETYSRSLKRHSSSTIMKREKWKEEASVKAAW